MNNARQKADEAISMTHSLRIMVRGNPQKVDEVKKLILTEYDRLESWVYEEIFDGLLLFWGELDHLVVESGFLRLQAGKDAIVEFSSSVRQLVELLEVQPMRAQELRLGIDYCLAWDFLVKCGIAKAGDDGYASLF